MIEIKKFELKFNFLTILLLLLLLSIIISTIFSLAPDLSFWGNERRQGLVSFLLYTLFFIIVGSSLKKKEQVEHIITALVAVGLVNSLMAILQYYNMNIFATSSEMLMANGHYRAYGATGNPLFLAGWLSMAIPLTGYRVYDFLKRKGWQNPWLYCYIAILLLEIIALMLTFTRGAIVAFVFSFFVGVVMVGIIKKIRWLWISAIIIFILISASVISINTPSNPLKIPKNNIVTMRFSNLLGEGSSFHSRTLIWKMLSKPIKERVWVGVGPDAFGPFSYSKEYFDKELMREEMSSFQKRLDRAHNIILDSMLSTGIIGTVLLFGMFIYVLFWLFKNIIWPKNENYKYLFLALFLAIIAYIVQGMTAFSDVTNYALLFMFLAILYFAITNNPSREEEISENRINVFSSRSIWWYPLLIIPLGLFFYFMVCPPYANEANYFKAMKMMSDKSTSSEGQDLLIETWENNPRLEKVNNSTLGLITNSEDENKIKWFEEELLEMKKKMPEELFFPFMLSYTYHRWGELKNDSAKFQASEKTLDDAMNVFGNKYQLYTTYIFILSDRCEFDRADAKIAEALDFSTYLKGQYYLYGAKGAMGCGNMDKAIVYLNEITNVRDVISYSEKFNMLGKIYVEKGDIPKAVENWKVCIQVNPYDVNCLGNLAINYANADQYDQALEYAYQLQKADKKRGDDMISQISALKAEFEAKKK